MTLREQCHSASPLGFCEVKPDDSALSLTSTFTDLLRLGLFAKSGIDKEEVRTMMVVQAVGFDGDLLYDGDTGARILPSCTSGNNNSTTNHGSTATVSDDIDHIEASVYGISDPLHKAGRRKQAKGHEMEEGIVGGR
ncbi:predicted protein [Lichtheimia corymbifera JMRC:FSU:9682]|uniref:Uncharacterized protein n=1 Tax=Lichtheimia corymbifera JMRC:FSU:9682 TaxID=1263082 RepID=A0A068RIR2_9FUNG|nr:predicted protein [Lichtheimia corymbifera JMRC:FSU:9682]